MCLSNKKLVQIAEAIREQLQRLRIHRYGKLHEHMQILTDYLVRLQNNQRKLNICGTRAWNAAATRIAKNIDVTLCDLPHLTQKIEQAIGTTKTQIPSLRDVYEELIQAGEEFGGFRYIAEDRSLAVTTDPIELEGVYLGEFEIQLHIPSLTEMQYNTLYSVVALDPHPAGSNQCVTHPHVSDEKLCAGDAAAAIQQALANGRICDLFQLVHAVLTNYNPESPFVSLDEWEGIPCYDCGCSMHSDDRWFCNACESDFCEDCISLCRQCDDAFCLNCLKECPACGDATCATCMTECPNCGNQLCPTCLEDNQCPCIEEMEVEDESEENTTISENEQVRQSTASATEAA